MGFQLDFPSIARSCGYRAAFSATSEFEVKEVLARLRSMDGPVLLELRVSVASRDDLGRPTTTPVENKESLMKFLKDE